MVARAASLGDKSKSGQKKVEIWGWKWDMGWGEANCHKSACKCLNIQASLRPANKNNHRLNRGIHTYRPNQDISLDI